MNLFHFITDPRRALWFFGFGLLLLYAAIPLAADQLIDPNPYFVWLAQLTLVAVTALYIGSRVSLFDGRFRPDASRIPIDPNLFHIVVWSAFAIFALFTIVTAPTIPLLSAFDGASVEDLDRQRGEFLKLRTGFETILIYLSTLFTSALLPYSMAHLYIHKYRARHLLALVFLGFAISFLVKALFITVIAPIVYVLAQHRKSGSLRLLTVSIAGIALLYAITKLAVGDVSSADIEPPPATAAGAEIQGAYFSSQYRAEGTADFLLWRIFAVPMFTAADTLQVFTDDLRGDFLNGATSSFFAALLGLERVPLEQLVYAHQFGWNDLAHANAVYITDIYANFGWFGLIIASLFIGQSLRWFRLSSDDALKAQWLLFCYMLFSGSIFGVMMSNGYALILFMLLFAGLDQDNRVAATTARRD